MPTGLADGLGLGLSLGGVSPIRPDYSGPPHPARDAGFEPCRCYHTGLPVSIARIARRYLISGRVQGVGFRMFAESAARREGVHGWVRNLADRRVEVVCEGEADAIERFERAIRQGPTSARVDRVEIDSTSLTIPETGFNIR
jgi:acylphosphatase